MFSRDPILLNGIGCANRPDSGNEMQYRATTSCIPAQLDKMSSVSMISRRSLTVAHMREWDGKRPCSEFSPDEKQFVHQPKDDGSLEHEQTASGFFSSGGPFLLTLLFFKQSRSWSRLKEKCL
jgi:hypothetical protein